MFSVPLSFELPRPGVTRPTALRSSDFPPRLRARALRRGGRLVRCDVSIVLPVGFLGDLILLELFVEIAARSVDDFGGLRDVPAVLAELGDEIRPLGVVLELA